MAFLYVMLRGRTAAPVLAVPSAGGTSVLRFRKARWGPLLLCASAALPWRCWSGWIEPLTWADRLRCHWKRCFAAGQSVLLMMALGILVAPLVEETIFRGCIYPVIAAKVRPAGGRSGHRHPVRVGACPATLGRLGPDRSADLRGHRPDLYPLAHRHRCRQLFRSSRLQLDSVCGLLSRHRRPAAFSFLSLKWAAV